MPHQVLKTFCGPEFPIEASESQMDSEQAALAGNILKNMKLSEDVLYKTPDKAWVWCQDWQLRVPFLHKVFHLEVQR